MNFLIWLVKDLHYGDTKSKQIAEYSAKARYPVEIFTGDKGLKSYEPSQSKKLPKISPPQRRKYKN